MGSVVKQCALTREIPHRLEQKVFHLVPATAAHTVTGTATGLFWVCGGGGAPTGQPPTTQAQLPGAPGTAVLQASPVRYA
jgi:hypothetical protein